MSLEGWIPLIVLVLWPLIQMLQEIRKKNREAQRRPQQPVQRPPHPRPDIPKAPVPTIVVPLDLPAISEAKASKPLSRVVVAPPDRSNERRRDLIRSLHTPNGQRRAFVLATILGPCRANEWRSPNQPQE